MTENVHSVPAVEAAMPAPVRESDNPVMKGLLFRERRRGLSNGERKMLHTARQILLSELVLAEDQGYQEMERRVERAMFQSDAPQS